MVIMEQKRIILGCMRTGNLQVSDLENLIYTALDLGINYFDHADIYGRGKAESLFGEVLAKNKDLRSKIILQTKCGICDGYYDNSKEHILFSVTESLKRLKTDYLDYLLIHRPDVLTDAREIAEAFAILSKTNKVKYFGVSNMSPSQISYLQKYLDYKIVINQVQLSICHSLMLDRYFNVNCNNDLASDRDGGLLEYARKHDITIQAWSILQASWEEGSFLNHPHYPKLNQKLEELAEKYQVTPAAIAVSWILTIPGKIDPIVGTTNPLHLQEIAKAKDVKLSREEWYSLYKSVKGPLP